MCRVQKYIEYTYQKYRCTLHLYMQKGDVKKQNAPLKVSFCIQSTICLITRGGMKEWFEQYVYLLPKPVLPVYIWTCSLLTRFYGKHFELLPSTEAASQLVVSCCILPCYLPVRKWFPFMYVEIIILILQAGFELRGLTPLIKTWTPQKRSKQKVWGPIHYRLTCNRKHYFIPCRRSWPPRSLYNSHFDCK